MFAIALRDNKVELTISVPIPYSFHVAIDVGSELGQGTVAVAEEKGCRKVLRC